MYHNGFIRIWVSFFMIIKHIPKFQKNEKSGKHANSCYGKPIVPTVRFAYKATYQRRDKCAQVYTHVVYGKTAITAWVFFFVQRAQNGRHIRFEKTTSDDNE